MLQRFNGAELFIDAIPFVTILGLSLDSDPPTSDWFIDRMTLKWRSGIGQTTDWVMAMTNYGGMQILERNSLVREWDSSQRKWSGDRHPFYSWVEKVLHEGAVYLDGG
jgi:hypothetical protein